MASLTDPALLTTTLCKTNPFANHGHFIAISFKPIKAFQKVMYTMLMFLLPSFNRLSVGSLSKILD